MRHARSTVWGDAEGSGNAKTLLMEVILQTHEVPGANTPLLRRTPTESRHYGWL
ncbi:MAG TPA: hypothetical protein VN875_03780 [Candidatus Binatus sp.]|jgi:hypothetical protein|nr:hypothetical protein [Candidatus Binatus sp.]